MQSAAQSPSRAESFASILSAFAPSAPAPQKNAWSDDALADDVTTISYESALKAHSRYKPAPEPEPLQPRPSSQSPIAPRSSAVVARASSPATAPAAEPKSASITIRMTAAECAQLKQRAAEAGMTISAYLRSCTFEAEALRGQVKEALAQLRASATPKIQTSAPASTRTPVPRWLFRAFAHRGDRIPVPGTVS